jgi:hypothetical protein
VYLTQAYLNEMLGTEKVSALVGVTGQSLARTIDAAEAEVETVLLNAGYGNAVPSSTYTALPAAGAQPATGECPRSISLLAYGAWLELVHGGQGIELPAQFAAYVKKLDLVRTGKMELPGLAKKGVDKDTGRGVGGVMTTDPDPDSETGRPAIFTRESMRDGGY